MGGPSGPTCGIYRSRTAEFLRRRPARRSDPSWDMNESLDGESANLISDEDQHSGRGESNRRLELPPEWVDDLDATNELVSTIKERMAVLNTMHNKHINQPSFDGGMEQEQEIEICTAEITGYFHKCQKNIQVIAKKGVRAESSSQQALSKNVAAALAKDVQELSMTFRKDQSRYLKRLRGQEDRNRSYGLDGASADSAGSPIDNYEDENYDVDDGFTDEQLDKLKSNTANITQREQEITNIVSSIHELAEIFKDLGSLISEQGTILDRIDYNIEMATHSVSEGRKQLEKAETYQKRSSKKLLILLLVVIIVGMFFAVVFKKKVVDDQGSTTVTSAPTEASRFLLEQDRYRH